MLYLRRRDVLVRIAICGLSAIAMWAMMRGWSAPFNYRTGYEPQRTIISRVAFDVPDEKATEKERERVASQVVYTYDQNPEELNQRRAELVNLVAKIIATPTPAELGTPIWDEFFLVPKDQPPPTPKEKAEAYQRFREALSGEGKLAKLKEDLADVLRPYEQRGLLQELQELSANHKGNQLEIDVRDPNQPEVNLRAKISDVMIVEAVVKLQKSLDTKLDSLEVSSRVFAWLAKRLPTTLKLNRPLSEAAEVKAAAEVKTVYSRIDAGKPLAKAGEPLTEEKLSLLRMEHDAIAAKTGFSAKLYRSLAVLGMFLALNTLCGYYVYYRERRLLANLRRFGMLQALIVLTLGLCLIAARDDWRAELIPLLLFGMTVAIAYQQELALLLSAALSLVIVLTLGHGLSSFVILLSAAAGAILMLGRIRSRSKLIYVGICAGVVAALTTLGVQVLNQHSVDATLLADAGRVAIWSVVAGFLVTGLLPFIESLFEVLTDISLLELGDIAHPLLQELVRRAPGTYNHSINVASIAEAAAESIGAHGLLVRVGAYFHDIGKMLKPGYFIENQGTEGNRHESLLPAMSTLIIIAHIKDGADLARQHHLPQPIIDFIQQHHGTTLVEYFFRRASEQSTADPFAADVDENAYRYPGPKPQTKEAAVLMLADAVESASRVLVEPTPARIESLVHDIARKRLLDGQFNECGLTLEELNAVEDSLVKSLTAVYHGRVKYPERAERPERNERPDRADRPDRESREQRTA